VLVGGALVALAGCGPQEGDPSLLARVGEVRIVTDDLQRLADRQTSERKGGLAPAPDYRGLLQTLVDREVLLLGARARGLEADSLVRERLAIHEEEGLVREMLYRQVTARLTVGPEEVEREYERGGWGEETKSMEIFVSTPERVQAVQDSLAAGVGFRQVAKLYAEDRLFKIPTGRPQITVYAPKDAPRRVAEAVTSLAVGQVVGPLAVDEGMVFAQALERYPVSLDQVAEKVTKWLTAAKREALRDVYYISLQKSHVLELNREGMDLVMAALTTGDGGESLSAEEGRTPVYTYGEGHLDVAGALARVAGKARRWPRVEEGLVVEDLRKALRRQLVLLDARVQGIDQTEAFKRWVRGQREDLAISRLRSQILEQELEIGEADIRARYEQMKDRLQQPGIARVQDLLVRDPDQARHLRQLIEGGADMAEIIAQHGLRPGTDEGVIQVHDVETVVYGEAWLKAVMRAPLEELQGPIQSRGGYSVFRVLERQARQPYSLENPRIRKTVRREVVESQERELFNRFLTQLRSQYSDQVETFPDNLDHWVDERSGGG